MNEHQPAERTTPPVRLTVGVLASLVGVAIVIGLLLAIEPLLVAVGLLFATAAWCFHREARR